MADCTVAVADDASACAWNPGGLAFIEGNISVVATHSQLVPDWDGVYSRYGAAALRLSGLGTFAASVTYLTYGEQLITTPDDSSPFATFKPYEIIPSVAYALAIGDHVGAGLNVKHIKVALAPAEFTADGQDVEGSTIGFDLGGEFRTSIGEGPITTLLRVGGAVQNLGGDIEYQDEEQSHPLPRNLKLGASCQFTFGTGGHLLVCTQFERSLVDDVGDDISAVFGLGCELEMSVFGLGSQPEGGGAGGVSDILSGRIGYLNDENREIDGISFGFGAGLRMTDRLMVRLDFARVPQAEGLEEPWRYGGSGWFGF